MDKVVLARATDVSLPPPDPLAIVAASRRSNHRCFHFMMAFNAQRTFLVQRRSGCGVGAGRCCAPKRWRDRCQPSGRSPGAVVGRLADERR
jgi:hypothetical protein